MFLWISVCWSRNEAVILQSKHNFLALGESAVLNICYPKTVRHRHNVTEQISWP